MKKIIINENQRGFLFKNGKYVKMLTAGKYYTFGGKEIEVADLDKPIISDNFDDVLIIPVSVSGSIAIKPIWLHCQRYELIFQLKIYKSVSFSAFGQANNKQRTCIS